MKVVVVTGSPRGKQSQTQMLARAVAEGARAGGASVDEVDVSTLKIAFCRACDVCHRTGTCIHDDDMVELRRKLLAADGIVLSSPNYFRSVTAQMKACIDRLSDVIHCQLFSGKYACSVSTAGGPASEEVTRYLDEILVSCGANVVGSVAESMCNGPAAMEEARKKATALGRELAEAIATRRPYPQQEARHQQMAGYFRHLIEMNRERWPYEYAQWTQGAGVG